jgi:hypothetical protein
MLGLRTFPELDVDPTPALDAGDAVDEVLRTEIGPFRSELVSDPELVIAADDGAGRLAWLVEMRTAEPQWGRWLVDAVTGEVFAFEPLLRHGWTATVEARVDDRSPDGGLVDVPLPWLSVGAQLTAVDGSLALEGDLATSVALTGRWARVQDYSGAAMYASLAMSADAPTALVTADGLDQAELDAFVSTNRVHAHAFGIAPENPWADAQTTVNVNIGDVCNAYFDGSSINFFREGGGCQNTARLADVVFHEYGHGFHYYAIVSGSYDYAMGEGAADYLSATITNDSEIAPGFFSGGQGIRDIGPDRVYPQDLTGEPHADGLIYAGALWDLRTALMVKHGSGPGVRRADALFYATLRGANGMTEAYGEVVLAADDDADVTNGVPDGCEIARAFQSHGLLNGQRVFGAIEVAHEPPATGTEISVRADRGECGGDAITGVTAHVVGADGAVEEVPLTSSGGAWTADLGGRKGAVRYWLTATDGTTTVQLPRAAPEQTFVIWGGRIEKIWCDSFEEGLGAWSHGAVSLDPALNGVDEWEAGAPRGLAGDPLVAQRGGRVAGLDLGAAGDGDGRYEPDVETWLESAPIATDGREGLRLQFWRKLAVEDAGFDQARVLVNGEEIWANAAGAHHEDAGWTLVDVPLDAVDEVTLRFELTADGGLELGGWAIDDVCLVAPGVPGGGDAEQERRPLLGGDGEGGCGCRTSTGAPAWLLLTGLLVRRRRSRR